MLPNSHINFKESISYALLQIEKAYSDAIALAIGKENYSYRDLFTMAKSLATNLMVSKVNRCLILSSKTVSAYVGLLGSLLAGKAYIFLNTKDSLSQLSQTVLLVDSDLLIVDEQYLALANKLNVLLSEKLTIVTLSQYAQLINSTVGSNDINFKQYSEYFLPDYSYQYAYMMFTSGSTGKPKGVPISHKNLKAFIDNICERIKPSSTDKFSHINELTFDFSVYEIFCCWYSGACLCVLPENYLYGIDKYIKRHQITYWSSVPSVVQLLNQLKKLNKFSFPSIRYSIFCGEALTLSAIEHWILAAPNTQVDNLYGPTEATVAITGYLWKKDDNDEVVPMGWPFAGQGFYLVNEIGQHAENGQVGEIYLYGEQIASEYWSSPDITKTRFTNFNGKSVYKTGDLALLDKNKGLIFKGRKDDQLKLSGYRVEKIDIENRIKSILETQAIAIIALKDIATDQVTSLVCFFAEIDCSIETAKILCQKALPYPMLPNKFIRLQQLPYSKNSKVDYQVLMQSVYDEQGDMR